MVKYSKNWKFADRAGKKEYLKDWLKLKSRGQPVKIVKMKKPIGKHKYAVYYKPILPESR